MPRARDVADEFTRAAVLLAEHGASEFARSLLRYRDGETIEDAFDVAPGWQKTTQLERRDAALLALKNHFADRSINAVATRIAHAVEHYWRTGWKADHRRGRRPAGAAGLVYDLLLVTEPLSVDWMRHLLAGLGCDSDGGNQPCSPCSADGIQTRQS
jgi:hypothetical protein